MVVIQQLRSSDLGPLVVRVLWEGSRLYYRRCGQTVILAWCRLTCDMTGLEGPCSLFTVADLPTQQVWETCHQTLFMLVFFVHF